jgi:membrane protein YdbS with pleckstrin-like domain
MQQDELLEEGEIILEKVRKHWIVYIEDIVSHTFGCILFMIAASFISSIGLLSFISKDSSAYLGMVLVMFVIIFWTSFFYAWTKEYLDVWYVTDRHIIAVNQKQMFEREEAFMELARIQDVLFEKNGFLATWLGYGRLRVQSAGVEQEFVIENVHDVEQVAHRIMELRDATKHKNIDDR